MCSRETPSGLRRRLAWNVGRYSSAADRAVLRRTADCVASSSRVLEAESTAMRAGGFALIGAAAFAAHAAELPPEIERVLTGHGIPADGRQHRRAGRSTTPQPLLSHLADVPRSPASVMKVVTTWSALEYLGPAYTWPTEVYFLGEFDGRKLDGDLALKGYGDPYLVVEEVWKLLRALRRMGLTEISGDLVLDDSHFAIDEPDPGAFDGQPYRTYNVVPNALLMNFKAVQFQFMAGPGAWPRQRRDGPRARESQDRQQPGARRRAVPRLSGRHLVQSRGARRRSSASCSTGSSRAAATSTAWAARCCSTTRSRSACSRRCGRKSAGRSTASCAGRGCRRRRRRRSSGNRSRSARSSAASTRTATTS